MQDRPRVRGAATSGRSQLPRRRPDLQRIPGEFATVAPARLPAAQIWKNSSESPGTAGAREVTDSSLIRQRAARCRFLQTPKDGRMWFTEKGAEKIGAIDMSG